MSASGGIAALIARFMAGDVDDEAMTRWLRGVCASGLSFDDTFDLTMALAHSGDCIEWRADAPVVDKHSTGGVGDAVTLVAVPLAAACGANVAKLSGRALGHTGGTLDKLECIPGLRTDLPVQAFKRQVLAIGCAVASASERLAPADKKLYALRHRTGTVASIPLIAASVMSKKIAAGAHGVVLDVKFGRGAFMQSFDEARELADVMRRIGERAGRRAVTMLTSMEQPLANSAGDALEMDEALSLLEGRGASADLRAVACAVAQRLVEAAGGDASSVPATLQNGAALEKFKAMVEAQGGQLDRFDRTFPHGAQLTAERAGWIDRIDALQIGDAIAAAKAAAAPVEAQRFGVRLLHRLGERVQRGDVLALCWLPSGAKALTQTFGIAQTAPPRTDAIKAGAHD